MSDPWRMVARWTNPIVWRSKRHAGWRLWRFAHAEDGSRLDLLAAANGTTDPGRAALYLRHAADEARHARMFAAAAADRRDDLPAVRADDDHLFERLGEIGFLAFVHRGEARGRAQFEAYHSWFATRDPRTAAMFEVILADERRHEAYTRELLIGLAGDRAAGELRRAALWEAWRAWRRLGSGLATALWTLLVFPLYVSTAPLALLTRWLRPARAGWLPPE